MQNLRPLTLISLAGTVLLAVACGPFDQRTQSVGSNLAGTSWQLVKFQSGNGTILTPDDKAK